MGGAGVIFGLVKEIMAQVILVVRQTPDSWAICLGNKYEEFESHITDLVLISDSYSRASVELAADRLKTMLEDFSEFQEQFEIIIRNDF